MEDDCHGLREKKEIGKWTMICENWAIQGDEKFLNFDSFINEGKYFQQIQSTVYTDDFDY